MRYLKRLLVLTIALGAAFGDVSIHDLDEFIEFTNQVNTGTNFEGSTVFLEADIDFGEGLTSDSNIIGNTTSRYFRGTFDGQGHRISNLKINSTLPYVGLFGYAHYGMSIKDLTLDSTCSVTSSTNGNAYVGGLIGYCYAVSRPCSIENSINLANVSFSGKSRATLYMGGLAGYMQGYSQTYTSSIRNCDNYGAVTQEGDTGTSYIGGVVGYLTTANATKFLQFCFNYGRVAREGKTSGEIFLGGIVGRADSTSTIYAANLQNCINFGAVHASDLNSGVSNIGGIVGYYYQGSSAYKYLRSCINYGTISCDKQSGNNMYLGGIAGFLYATSGSYTTDVRNCANYGRIHILGGVGNSYVGGIVGYLGYSRYHYIYNCLNDGEITHNGTISGGLYTGGIVGHNYYSHVENCLNMRTTPTATTTNSYPGGIVGYSGSYGYVDH